MSTEKKRVFVFCAGVLRDRFRTMVNVMGDALATGIMAHICRKDFVKEGEQVRGRQNSISGQGRKRLWFFSSFCKSLLMYFCPPGSTHM